MDRRSSRSGVGDHPAWANRLDDRPAARGHLERADVGGRVRAPAARAGPAGASRTASGHHRAAGSHRQSGPRPGRLRPRPGLCDRRPARTVAELRRRVLGQPLAARGRHHIGRGSRRQWRRPAARHRRRHRGPRPLGHAVRCSRCITGVPTNCSWNMRERSKRWLPRGSSRISFPTVPTYPSCCSATSTPAPTRRASGS